MFQALSYFIISYRVRELLGPEYVENISSRSLRKTSDQRKLRLLSVYFSILEWWNIQLYQKRYFPTWQFGKIVVLVNFITQKLKRKHLAISVFSGQRFFWGNERKYFPHNSGLKHFILILVNLWKKKINWNDFCKEFCKKLLKNHNTWNIRHLINVSFVPSTPATQRISVKIVISNLCRHLPISHSLQ